MSRGHGCWLISRRGGARKYYLIHLIINDYHVISYMYVMHIYIIFEKEICTGIMLTDLIVSRCTEGYGDQDVRDVHRMFVYWVVESRMEMFMGCCGREQNVEW